MTYLLQINTKKATESGRVTRGISNKNFIEPKTFCTFIGDATRLWNKFHSLHTSLYTTAKKLVKTITGIELLVTPKAPTTGHYLQILRVLDQRFCVNQGLGE